MKISSPQMYPLNPEFLQKAASSIKPPASEVPNKGVPASILASRNSMIGGLVDVKNMNSTDMENALNDAVDRWNSKDLGMMYNQLQNQYTILSNSIAGTSTWSSDKRTEEQAKLQEVFGLAASRTAELATSSRAYSSFMSLDTLKDVRMQMTEALKTKVGIKSPIPSSTSTFEQLQQLDYNMKNASLQMHQPSLIHETIPHYVDDNALGYALGTIKAALNYNLQESGIPGDWIKNVNDRFNDYASRQINTLQDSRAAAQEAAPDVQAIQDLINSIKTTDNGYPMSYIFASSPVIDIRI
ncbi:hypothetical protein [Paenibacillus wulumuqiensis]|uniref:hypothetical protein n=1 Tax=Paenibacillus wulumuqiensis TaxID=1567107 RepID=UPI0006192796|nr:hypothetical protein [Paenibacillus wulumuqiensis]